MIRMVSGYVRSFWMPLAVLWVTLGISGILYARYLGAPPMVATVVILAFLLESSFYFATGVDQLRKKIEACLRPPVLSLVLTLSGLVPYCTYSLPTGNFRWSAVGVLIVVSGSLCLWYAVLPRTMLVDISFLCFSGGIALSKVLSVVYTHPYPGLHVETLGQLMWIRLGISAVLSMRKLENVGFGFLPRKTDWLIGLRHYVYFLPVGLPIALSIGLVRFHPMEVAWWKAVLITTVTFFAMLWVVALAEEFFFRGLLQQWLTRWSGSSAAGLAIASLIFGLAHLNFRFFPNWRFALLAGIAGTFYGSAYKRAGSIRAAMVAHALVNTTTRMLFSG